MQTRRLVSDGHLSENWNAAIRNLGSAGSTEISFVQFCSPRACSRWCHQAEEYPHCSRRTVSIAARRIRSGRRSRRTATSSPSSIPRVRVRRCSCTLRHSLPAPLCPSSCRRQAVRLRSRSSRRRILETRLRNWSSGIIPSSTARRRTRRETSPHRRPTAPGSASPTRTFWNWPAMRAPSSSTTGARWTWNGPRTVSTGSSTSSRPARRLSPPSAARPRWSHTCSRAEARYSPRGGRSAKGSPRAR